MSEQNTAPRRANIDGFFRNPGASATLSPRPTTPQKMVGSSSATPVKKVSVRSVSHAPAHKPQPSITLMRQAVKPPKASFKSHTRVAASLMHKTPSLIATKRSAYSLDEQRLERAKQTSRSPQVSRHASTHHVAVQFAPLAVKPAPAKPEPTDPQPRSATNPVDIFEHALANASHYVDVRVHRAHFKKKRRTHLVSLTAGGLAMIVIAGFAAYQNSPSLQLKVASMESGVSAHMPNFKAAGFAYNGAKAGDGKLTVGFKGKQGSYELTQQTTNLSSDDMLQTIAATDASGYPTYATVKAGDTTVYRFSNTDATWVSSGKWYSVSGTSALTDSQVTTLVNNL